MSHHWPQFPDLMVNSPGWSTFLAAESKLDQPQCAFGCAGGWVGSRAARCPDAIVDPLSHLMIWFWNGRLRTVVPGESCISCIPLICKPYLLVVSMSLLCVIPRIAGLWLENMPTINETWLSRATSIYIPIIMCDLLVELLSSNRDWFHMLYFWCVMPDLLAILYPDHGSWFVVEVYPSEILSASGILGRFTALPLKVRGRRLIRKTQKTMILSISHHHYPWRVGWWPHVYIHKWRCPGPGLATWKQTVISSWYIDPGQATFSYCHAFQISRSKFDHHTYDVL